MGPSSLHHHKIQRRVSWAVQYTNEAAMAVTFPKVKAECIFQGAL